MITPNNKYPITFYASDLCECGAFKLSDYCKWVALPNFVHTPDRCDRYESLDVSIVNNSGILWPTIKVTWP